MDDEELALVIHKFQRAFNNRQGRGKAHCNCGKTGHFVTECPKKKSSSEDFDHPLRAPRALLQAQALFQEAREWSKCYYDCNKNVDTYKG